MATGSIAANFHEGSRSEYLAHYVFAGFGTAVAIPRQEDHGIDLTCTITERKGQRAWPTDYFTVQVKSPLSPWEFDCPDSVTWLVNNPYPILLCFVDRSEARLRVFHTCPRFSLWSLPPLPEQATLTPEDTTEGHPTTWSSNGDFSLGAPILDFTINDSLKCGFTKKTVSVLRAWVRFDADNLRRIQCGLRTFTMPASYRTNEPPDGPIVEHGIGQAKPDDLGLARAVLQQQLGWVARQLHAQDDSLGASLGVLLLRHLSRYSPSHHEHQCHDIYVMLDGLVNAPGHPYVYRGVDNLLDDVREKLGLPLRRPPGDQP